MTTVPSGRVVVGQLHRVRRGRRKTFASEPAQGPVARPARVAVQLALAHQIRKAIDSGEFADQAAVACQLGLTRARLTQLLGLTLLAPDIQERVLGLEAVGGVEPLSERALRPVAREISWAKQGLLSFASLPVQLGLRQLDRDRPNLTDPSRRPPQTRIPPGTRATVPA